MATHPSILTWKTPLTEVRGGLQFIGLQRVTHTTETLAGKEKATLTFLFTR